MDYFIYILAYLIIGFVISLYVGKQKRYDTTGYMASGLLVLLWPLLFVFLGVLLAIFILSGSAYGLGRLVYSMKDKENNETKTTDRETEEDLS